MAQTQDLRAIFLVPWWCPEDKIIGDQTIIYTYNKFSHF